MSERRPSDFEYKVTQPSLFSLLEAEKWVNRMASEGWDLVCCAESEVGMLRSFWIFRRLREGTPRG